jgi:hypothetical protein
MITIICDFRKFYAKKMAFFSKTNVAIKFLHNLAVFGAKNSNFWTKLLNNNNIGPGHSAAIFASLSLKHKYRPPFFHSYRGQKKSDVWIRSYERELQRQRCKHLQRNE